MESCGFFAGKLPSSIKASEGLGNIELPPGFSIQLYADELPGARSMTLSPTGTLFVGTRDNGSVYAVQRRNDGTTEVSTIAQDLDSPNGVALLDNDLYVAEISRVIKFDGIGNSPQRNPSFTVVRADFPSEPHHGWKFIAFGPDKKLYVPVGMPCNICETEDKRFGSIMRMNPDGSDAEIFASGVRNTVGFDWHPGTGDLWFTDNGRDWLGNDLPPDELNVAQERGLHFGFPYAYGRNHADPEYQSVDLSKYTPAALELGPHVAALGMRFYTGTMFPEQYRNGIFIAEHGSWNRTSPIGYRVMFVSLEENKPTRYEAFARGWLQASAAWGRPVDVEVMEDGSLLVSDDKAGAVYRIVYSE